MFMVRQVSLSISIALTLGFAQGSLAAPTPGAAPAMPVGQIIDRNIAARGGAPAWQAVQSATISGKLDAGNTDSLHRSQRIAEGEMEAAALRHHKPVTGKTDAPSAQVQLPFVIEMKRPNKSRVEVVFAGKTAVQVYDGTNGWKMRPYLNRTDYEP